MRMKMLFAVVAVFLGASNIHAAFTPTPVYILERSVVNSAGNTNATASCLLHDSFGECLTGASWSTDSAVQQGFFNEYFLPRPTPTMTVTPIRTFDGELLSKEWVYAAPNPIRGNQGNIVFDLAETAGVDLKIMTTQGQLVISKHWESLPAGQNRWAWNTSNISNGIYFLLVKASNGGKTTLIKKKIALVR